MKKLCVLLISALLIVANVPVHAYEDTFVKFLVNGNKVDFPYSPFVRDGITYVDAKTLSKALGLEYKTFDDHHSITISNKRTSVCFVPDEQFATVSDITGQSDKEFYFKLLTAPCLYANGSYIVSARDISNIFGYSLGFDVNTQTVYFGFAPQMISQATRDSVAAKSYYFQNQAEFNLPSSGSGYCWVCSYAMVISNLTGTRITPNDIAAINLTKTSSGAYCYHNEIASAYNIKFVTALSPASPYYAGRDSVSGGTYIQNPEKSDAVVREALKEALALHPEGVMVRYAGYPHTMVAVATENGIILFNDPAPTSSNYSDMGSYQGVPFIQTCVAKKGFVLSDITFIQAID